MLQEMLVCELFSSIDTESTEITLFLCQNIVLHLRTFSNVSHIVSLEDTVQR